MVLSTSYVSPEKILKIAFGDQKLFEIQSGKKKTSTKVEISAKFLERNFFEKFSSARLCRLVCYMFPENLSSIGGVVILLWAIEI